MLPTFFLLHKFSTITDISAPKCFSKKFGRENTSLGLPNLSPKRRFKNILV